MLRSIHSSRYRITISTLVVITAMTGSAMISFVGIQKASSFQSNTDCEVQMQALIRTGKFSYRCFILAQNGKLNSLQNQSGEFSNELTPEEIEELGERLGYDIPVEYLKDLKVVRSVRDYLDSDSEQPYDLYSKEPDLLDPLIPGSTEELRNQPGEAFGGDRLPNVRGRLLPDGRIGIIPGQIARQMQGRYFNNFREFRETFWKLIAQDSHLNKGWDKTSMKRMRKGLAPFAPKDEQIGGGANKRLQLDHSDDLQHGGKVYDLDSIRIVTPRFHKEYGRGLGTIFNGHQNSSEGTLNKLLFGNNNPELKDKAAISASGGIDFSTLELRYIAEDSGLFKDSGLRYAFNATPTSSNKNLAAGRAAAVQASDAFFVWLALSPDKFWVNLNPDEPDRIIDPQFGKTDAGRILLQSDLLMKKTVAKLIHPDTALGKQFWQQLKRGRSGACLSFRQWIVPAPATVHNDGNGIYITDAPLNVKLESQYFQTKGGAGLLASCSTIDKKNEAHNESIYRKLILPRIEQAVNKAPEYAELRRVYRSRVAAEWYRLRSASKATAYRDIVNNGNVSFWPARQNWSPKQVFNQYVNSFTKGEFHVVHSRKWQEGNTIYTQKQFYVYGGVDFTNVFFKQLSSIDFQKTQGDFRQVVDNAMKSPVADQRGKIWLGGSTITSRAIWKSIWFYFALGCLTIPFLIYWQRSHRKGWQ
jgi:hypothetical protein